MKISISKQIAFLNKLIEDTKTSAVYWNRISANCVAAESAFPNYGLDPEGVFTAGFRDKGLESVLYLAMTLDGTVLCAVGTTLDTLVPLAHKTEEIGILLLRLFNLIYEQRPNVNRFIEQYLNHESTVNTDQ